MYHDPKPITSEPIWPDHVQRGDVVRFRFPVAEEDGEKPKLRPCLILETGTLNGRRSVTLAYGTSAHPKRNYGYEVIVKDKAAMRAAGLTKPTRFVAIRRITVSTEHPGFEPLCGTPVIGRLDAPLLQRMVAVRARLWAEHDIAAERDLERRRWRSPRPGSPVRYRHTRRSRGSHLGDGMRHPRRHDPKTVHDASPENVSVDVWATQFKAWQANDLCMALPALDDLRDLLQTIQDPCAARRMLGELSKGQ